VVLLIWYTTYGVAAYQHPARLISWEWLAMLVVLFLVRQLTVSVEDQHGLLSVLLASAVSLSAYGLYEAYESLPRTRADIPTVEALLQHPDKSKSTEFIGLDKDDPKIVMLFNRLQQPNAMGGFAHPNSFAGYLALLLPALIGAAYLVVRGDYPRWQKGLAALFAVAGATALWQTHSRGALFAVALVLLVLAGIVFRRFLLAHKLAAGLCCLLLVAGAVGLYESGLVNAALGKQQSTASVRSEYWRATWQMIQERPWFGVGPGNFGSNYTRFMSETASEEIKDPHNFALEIWATSGIFALLGLLGAFGAFFVEVCRRAWSAPVEKPAPPPPPPVSEDDLPPVRWTCYIGGFAGNILAIVLTAIHVERDAVVLSLVGGGVLAVIWFASFALFEQIRWTPHVRALVLTGGVVALLINLSVSGGIGVPQVAVLLWVVVALALNAFAPMPTRWLSGRPMVRYAMLPALVGVALINLFASLIPVTSAVHAMRHKPESEQQEVRQLALLEETAKMGDPDNAELNGLLARRFGMRYALSFELPLGELHPENLLHKSEQYLERARSLDPHGKQGYVGDYELHKQFAQEYTILESRQGLDQRRDPLATLTNWRLVMHAIGPSGMQVYRHFFAHPEIWQLSALVKTDATVRADAVQITLGPWFTAVFNDPASWRQYPWNAMKSAGGSPNFAKYKAEWKRAADILLLYLPNEPNDTNLHFQIAEALFHAEDRLDEAERHARRALELDEIADKALAEDKRAPNIARKLTDRHRKYLRQRLGLPNTP
jgi:O-Antigen ligase